MKKYYLEGITEENQRKLFEAANQVGLCKIYTNYGGGSRGKLKPTGLLSFIRKDPIKEADYIALTAALKGLGIKISPYVHDKGMKVSLNLVDYIPQDWYNREDNEVQAEAERRAKEIVDKFGGSPVVNHISVICKKREASKKEGEEKDEKKVAKLQTSALFEFETTEKTYEIYEKVRIGTNSDPLGKVRLFFHNEENNSYLSLITQGLDKPENQTEKEFEETLIQSFREVNKSIVQVNIYPVKYNNSYFGRVYLKSEEEGKNFLVDYTNFKSKIYGHYKEKTNMSFNISIDTKTLRKIKHAEKKAKETEEKIKKQTEATKREIKRPPGGAGQFGGAPNFPTGSFGSMTQGVMMPPSLMGGGMPRMDNLAFGAPSMPPKVMTGPGPMGVPMGMAPAGNQSNRSKIDNLIRDKMRILQMPENSSKRLLSEVLKSMAEEQNIVSSHEATKYINDLLKENSTEASFRFLEHPESLREADRKSVV